jgi:hypothetical protein
MAWVPLPKTEVGALHLFLEPSVEILVVWCRVCFRLVLAEEPVDPRCDSSCPCCGTAVAAGVPRARFRRA